MSERDQIVAHIVARARIQMALADQWPNTKDSHWYWRAMALYAMAADIKNDGHLRADAAVKK